MLLAEATAMGGFLETMSEIATWIFDQIGTYGSNLIEYPCSNL